MVLLVCVVSFVSHNNVSRARQPLLPLVFGCGCIYMCPPPFDVGFARPLLKSTLNHSPLSSFASIDLSSELFI